MPAAGQKAKDLLHNATVLGFLLVMAFGLLAARRASPQTGPSHEFAATLNASPGAH